MPQMQEAEDNVIQEFFTCWDIYVASGQFMLVTALLMTFNSNMQPDATGRSLHSIQPARGKAAASSKDRSKVA